MSAQIKKLERRAGQMSRQLDFIALNVTSINTLFCGKHGLEEVEIIVQEDDSQTVFTRSAPTVKEAFYKTLKAAMRGAKEKK
jgi:hypothetical protein